MNLRSRLLFAVFILCFNFLAIQAQTLYWVGGSGNFNDPNHWSLTSGGASANMQPGASNELIFDDNIENNSISVTLSGSPTIKSLQIKTYKIIMLQGSGSNPKLTIKERFEDILDNINFFPSVPFRLSNTGNGEGYLSTGHGAMSNDFYFVSGKWKVKKLKLSPSSKIEVSNAQVKFERAFVTAGTININNCPSIIFDGAIFTIAGIININGVTTFASTKSYLNKKPIGQLYSALNTGNTNSGKLNNNSQTNNAGLCVPNPIVVKPSCAPGCDGKIIFTIPAFTCFPSPPTPTAYIVTVGNSCVAVPAMTVGPGTYTIPNICSCLEDYTILIYDENFNLIDNADAAVTQPNISSVSSGVATSTVPCFGDCTGTINVTFFGGTAPYNFTITPPTGPQTFTSSNGTISQSSLCTGVFSVNTRDAGNCTQVFTRTFTSPTLLSSNASTILPICNSSCTAGYTISPTGGSVTTGYTVAFSTGPTFTVPSSGSASLTGLCAPALITATVTDKNNCKTTSSFSITQPSSIIATPSQTNINCGGACSGIASVSVTGGGGTYSYSWSPNAATTAINSSLCASSGVGIHTVTITDSPHGCVKTQTFNILDIPRVSMSNSVITNVTCSSFSTGAFNGTITGGTPGYTATLVRGSTTLQTLATGTAISFTGLPASPSYSLFIRDAVPCFTVFPFTILETASVSLSANTTSNTCPGVSAGSATLNASGGNGGPFTYTVNAASTSSILSGLASAVTFTSRATDVLGCLSNTISFTIAQPPTFVISAPTTSVNCFTASTGIINASTTGGTPLYTYTLVGPPGTSSNTTGTFNALPEGTYTIRVGDNTFPTTCSQSITVAITQPTSLPTGTITSTNPKCFGVCNGSLVGTASGGTGPYTFNWITPTTSINNTVSITGQCGSATPYTLNVVDSKTCAAVSITTLLTAPTQVSVALTPSHVTCFGLSNGQITSTVSGGTPGTPSYTYNWTGPGAFTSTSASLTSLGSGTYVVIVTDANLCTRSQTAIVTAPAASVVVSQSFTRTSCTGNCDGVVTATAANGATPYTYTFSGTPSSTNTTGIFNNVCGPFTITTRDNNACTATVSANVINPATITLGAQNFSQVTCFNLCNGIYTVTPSGGTAGTYNYTLTGPSPAITTFTVPTGSTATFTGLCAGNYILSVRDNTLPAPCSQTFAVAITQPTSLPTGTITSTNPKCFGVCNGSLVGTASGGTGPYTFNWITPTTSINNTVSITGQCGSATPYTLNVVDSKTCAAVSITTLLTAPTQVSVALTPSHVTCFGLSNGQITSTVSGGTPGTPSYTYNWTGPGAFTSTSASLTSLGSGTYVVIVTDANLCTRSQTAIVTAPAASVVVSQSFTRTSCTGNCDGVVTATAANGATPYTYTFSGTPSSTNTTGIFNNVCGPFTITTRDNNACTATVSANVINPATITLGAQNFSQVTCFNLCNGIYTVTPSGGTAGTYNYTLTGPSPAITTFTVPTGSTATFTGLCAGNYILSVRDNTLPAPCSQTFAVAITQPASSLAAVPAPLPASCFSVCDGALNSSNATGGTSTYTYQWISTTATVSGQNLGAQCAGNYTLKVTDSKACTFTTTAVVPEPAQITISSSVITNVTCFNGSNGGATITPAGGPSTTYSVNWSPSGLTGTVVAGLSSGTHVATVFSGPCSRTFAVVITQPSSLTLSQGSNPVRCLGDCNGTATISVVSGGVGPFTYSLTTAPTPTNSNGLFSALCSATLTSRVTDANGCSNTITVPVGTPTLALSIGAINTQSSCASCSGAATVTALGGTPSYSYVWTNSLGVIPAATNSVISSLCPGNHTVTATDNNSCAVSGIFSISPVIIVVTPISTSVTCFGGANGSATVQSVLGGVAPYTYTWNVTSPVQTSSIAANLSANIIYTVLVEDNTSPTKCIGTSTLMLVQPTNSISVAGTAFSVTCPSFSNGAVTTTVTGGPPGTITYSWSPTGLTTASISGVTDITHTVTVFITNTTGVCSQTAAFSVGSPSPPIQASIVPTDPSNCASPNNGNICLTNLTGGDGTYTYSWSPPAPTTSCISGLTAGPYQVTITSAGCPTVYAAILAPPPTPSLTFVSSQNVSCFSGTNGAASFSTTGTTPSFTWSPAATASVVSGGTTSATGLISGTYNVTMMDVNSCSGTNSVVITEPIAISVTSVVTNVTCNSGTNGAISLTVSGGTPGTPSYTFNWSTGTTSTGSVSSITSLTAATLGTNYSVTITDGAGCTAIRNFTLFQPAPFSITTTSTNINCFGNANGAATVVATPSAGVTYSWLPFGTFTGSTSAIVASLTPGIYTVVVTNSSCTAAGTNTVLITEPAALVGSVTINHNVTCFGNNNGTATYSVSGGTSPYTYTWTGNTSTTTIASSLTAGNYTATVVDNLGCTVATSFAITGPSQFSANLTPVSPLCPGATNGSITTVISGAQGNVSFTWNPAGTGQSPTGLGAGTGILTYTMNAVDDSLCVFTDTVTLTDPPTISVNLASVNPVCFGNCDGSATVTPINAVGTPTITWLNTMSVSASMGGLCSNPFMGAPNIYSVNIIDANSCILDYTFALNAPGPITLTTAIASASCGVSNGSITLNASGGTGALSYLWSPPIASPGNTNASQFNLMPNTYTVLISDANSCSTLVVVPLTASDGPTATPVFTNVTCFGNATGAAELTAFTPTNATFQWLPPLAANNTLSAVSSLTVGSYTVAITSPSNNCTNFYGFNITEPPQLTINANATISTCYGICDGAITFSVGGGVPGYTINWNGPTGFTGTATSYSNLCGGDYTISVLDAIGCSQTTVISLPVLNSISVSSVITNNTCFGTCAGAATINIVSTTTVSNAASVSWSNGHTGNTISGLCTGVYSVLVTDTRGCSSSFSIPVTSSPEIIVSSNVVSPNCNQCNGSASLAVIGGAGPAYTFSWSSGENSSEVSNKCAGIYQVLVKDVANCAKLSNIVFNSSSGITGDTLTIQPELCAIPCSGAATVSAIGGLAPIAYSWINPNLSINTQTIANLCPGIYFVQMTDANSCVRTASLEIDAASSLSLSTFVIPPTCSVSPPDGYIRVEATGNVSTLSYSWIPTGATTPTLNNVGPGSYTVIITDAGGCTDTSIVNVSNQTGPQITASQLNILCGSGLGTISTTVTSTGTVSYNWSNGNTTANAGSLQAGPITLTVTDVNGCITTEGFTIEASPAVEVHSNALHLRCNKDCNGIISILPLNGTLPYSFSLTSSNLSSVSIVPVTNSLCAGVYTAVVMDQNGCSDTTVMSLVEPTAVTSTVNSQNSTCSTLSNGSATTSASGGTSPYTFLWMGPSNFTATTSTLSNLLSGTYSVNATDSLGCQSTIVTMFLAPNVTIVANAGPDFSVCPGTDVVLSGTNSIGAVGFNWYTAIPGPTLANTAAVEVNATETMTMYIEALSSLAGCVDIDTAIVFVYPVPFLDVGVQSFTIPILSNTVIGGNPTTLLGGPTHTWAPAEFLDDAFAQNPVTSNSLQVTFTVSIAYGDGCMVSDTVNVSILPEVKINTGFSPNDDGKNDTWIIDYIEQFPNNTVEVYNRWGDQVFFSKGYEVPFDGRFKGQPLPVGTYYYVIKLNHAIYSKPYTGPLTIFR